MTSSPHLPLSRRRWLRRTLLGLVLFELFYVLAFEWAARSGRLESWINRRPEKIVIGFESAHSLLPFWVMTGGLELHGQTPKVRWRVRVESAAGWISPFGLFRRTLRIPRVEARGGGFWLRREAEPLAPDAPSSSTGERERLLPALAALPPLPVPRPPSTRPKWSFELPRIEAHGFREIWLEGLRLAGEFDARGGFFLLSGRELEVGPSRVDFAGVRAALGEVEIGRDLVGGVDATIERYPFRERRGRAMLPFLSGLVELRGRLADGELLALFLRRAPWIAFGSTLGELETRLVVDRGDLKPGSRVEFRHPKLETKIFDFQAQGDALVQFEVQPPAVAGAEEGAVLTVLYRDFEVRSGEAAAPQLRGSGMSIVATTSELELGAVLDSTRVQIDLGTARLPDLASFNSWLPASSGLKLVSGAGALTGSLDADLAANRAKGAFRASVEGAAVRYRDLDLAGGVAVEIEIADANLERRAFDLTGTRLELTDFRSPQAEAASGKEAVAGWWAHFRLVEGRLILPPQASASGRFAVDLRDSVPLVGLFETRKNLPNWVASLLEVNDVRAGGTFAWNRDETTLDHLATRFRGATIEGRIRFGRDSKRGLLLVERRPLALGLRIDDAKKDWKFTGVRSWYEASDLGAPPSEPPAEDLFSHRLPERE